MPNADETCVVSHVGICVSSIERSRKFYEEVFGFELVETYKATDDIVTVLGELKPPIGCTAYFFKRGQFNLELLHYAELGAIKPDRPRVLNDLGLTHLSIGVQDLDATLEKVVQYGGTPLPHTRLPTDAMMILDPDGQKIELIPRAYAQGARD